MLPLLELPGYLVQLLRELGHLNVDLEVADLLADLEELHDVARVPLDRLDSHVVVHAFLHKGRVCEGLGVVRDVQGVEFRKVGQVVQHVGLVIAKVADRVLTVVRVLKGADTQGWETVEVEDFFEVAYFVVRNVQFF